jgi:hypothetical protein
MVHEVDLSIGRLRHLPARGQVVCDVIALLTQVLQLVALKNEKNVKNLKISTLRQIFGSGLIWLPPLLD